MLKIEYDTLPRVELVDPVADGENIGAGPEGSTPANEPEAIILSSEAMASPLLPQDVKRALAGSIVAVSNVIVSILL